MHMCMMLALTSRRRICRYVRSVDSKQLGGKNSTTSACEPYAHVGTAGAPNNGIINPCGLIAHSNFNDTITVLNPAVTPDVDVSSFASACFPHASAIDTQAGNGRPRVIVSISRFVTHAQFPGGSNPKLHYLRHASPLTLHDVLH